RPPQQQKAEDTKASGPPPRACFGSEGEEEVTHLFNHLRVAARGTARVPAEVRQHLLLRRGKAEERRAAFKVALLVFVCELAIFDFAPRIYDPWLSELDAVVDEDLLLCMHVVGIFESFV